MKTKTILGLILAIAVVFSVSAQDRSEEAENFRKIGLAALSRKDYDAAIIAYTGALRVDPTYGLVYMQRGDAYRGKGWYELSITDYNEAIKYLVGSVHLPLAFNGLGLTYYNMGDYDRAIASFNEAIRVGPLWRGFYINRIRACIQKGNFTQARSDVNTLLARDPYDGSDHFAGSFLQEAQVLDAELRRRGY